MGRRKGWGAGWGVRVKTEGKICFNIFLFYFLKEDNIKAESQLTNRNVFEIQLFLFFYHAMRSVVAFNGIDHTKQRQLLHTRPIGVS